MKNIIKKYKIIIFIIFCLFQYSYDRITSTCDTNKGELLLFIHHILSAYIYLGYLFNPLLHMILLIIIIVHWLTYNNKCFITVYTNKYCGNPENNRFRDILYVTGISKNYPNLMYIVLFLFIVYDIYKIYKKN